MAAMLTEKTVRRITRKGGGESVVVHANVWWLSAWRRDERGYIPRGWAI